MPRRYIDFAAQERQRLLELERQERARTEAQAVASGIAETACLEAQRGAEFLVPEQKRGERQKPIRRMTGLEWLHGKGRITDEHKEAGERYGGLYRAARGECSIRSHLNVSAGGQDSMASMRLLLSSAEARVHAQRALHETRARLSHQTRLVDALDLVCGEEKTPREASPNGAQASALEALVMVALDLLAQQGAR